MLKNAFKASRQGRGIGKGNQLLLPEDEIRTAVDVPITSKKGTCAPQQAYSKYRAEQRGVLSPISGTCA